MSNLSQNESVVGNAEQPPTNHTSKQDNTQGKFWKVNYHLKESESFESVFKTLEDKVIPFCAEYIFGEEYGRSGKTRHIEGGFITREDRKRRTTIQNTFKFSDCQKSKKRNWKALCDYCSKECNKVIHSKGVVIPEKLITIQNLRPYQQKVIDILDTDPDDRTINWFYGDKCIGKTKILFKLCAEFNTCILPTSEKHAKSQIYKTHSQVKCYCLNLTADESEFQSHSLFTILEAIKDGMFSSAFGTECNGMCQFNPKHLLVMANERPDFSKTQIDTARFNLFKINKDFEAIKETIIVNDKGGYREISFTS